MFGKLVESPEGVREPPLLFFIRRQDTKPRTGRKQIILPTNQGKQSDLANPEAKKLITPKLPNSPLKVPPK